MKKKIGTILDETLLWKAKGTALQEKTTFSALLEKALREYLDHRGGDGHSRRHSVVQHTKGKLALDPKVLRQLMHDPDWRLW